MISQTEPKSDSNSVATLNHDNWLRMLQDDEPPKSSWRPRKSTKSRDQLSVQKFTKVTQSRTKVHRMGKIGPTEPRGVRACTRIRDAPAEKRRESKSHSLPKRPKIAKCRRAKTTWTLRKRRTGEAIPRAAKLGRIDNSRAQSLLNRDL